MSSFIKISVLTSILIYVSSCGKSDPAEIRARNNLPDPSYVAEGHRGQTLYRDNCGLCHGVGLQGTQKGPPLTHKTYLENHHADIAFFWAIKRGVVQHHWKFGNMPAQPQVSAEQSADIIAYVRQVQKKKGNR
ncbi:MAG: cytochrome c [Thiohalomonadales bacterium]